MLQNPSKYHPNPLTHFLALHSSTQAAHNARNNGNASGINHTASHILTNVSAFGLGVVDQRHSSYQQQQQINHHQQQQHPHNLHQHQQQQTLLAAQQQQQQQQQLETTHTMIQHNLSTTTHAHHHARQFLDATGTTLDVGKSFTIAAILGLQNRNSMEQNHRKDYNSVINLSLNGDNGGNNNDNQLRQRCSTPPISADEGNKICGVEKKRNSNQENADDNCQSNASDNNKFHCDNNNILVNPYLPLTTSTTATTTISNGNTNVFIATAQHGHHQLQQQQQRQQQQQLQQQQTHTNQHQHNHHHHHQNQHQHHHHHSSLMSTHVRANSFAAAAAVAAVNAVVNGAPTALQSLQQLHQHHAQQTSLNFSRDKLKSDNHTKKSSLKNKRVRTIFTPEQLERLEAEFERQQYMVGPERLYLAHTLQLTEAQVKVWFQNRRIKWRKHHLELTQQRLALLRQNQLPGPNNVTMPGISSLPSPDGIATAASNSSFDENDEPNIKSEQENLTNSQRSHDESDSELSVCNDSMDADSINDGDGDT